MLALKQSERIRPTIVRRPASSMACGYAMYTNRLGLCIAAASIPAARRGVLLNMPIHPALEAIYRQMAEAQVQADNLFINHDETMRLRGSASHV